MNECNYLKCNDGKVGTKERRNIGKFEMKE